MRQSGISGNKGHPSLTITQLGISKLPSSVGASNATLVQQTANTLGNATTGISAVNLNVSQGIAGGGQLVTGQNISGATLSTHSGSATVVPVAMNARAAGTNNLITGSISTLKNASAITVGKMMTQSQLAASSLESNVGVSSGCSGVAPTNVFIHHTLSQKPPSASNNGNVSSNSGIMVATTTSANISMGINNANISPNGGLASASSNVAAGAFLQSGSTIYYESVPTNSLQVSTSVLSLTTSTLTSSVMSGPSMGNQLATNLSISALPFAKPSISGNTSNATFTVMPPVGTGRTIGQLQMPVSNTSSQIQTVPIRFSQLQHGNISPNNDAGTQIIQTTHNTCGSEATMSSIIIPPNSNTLQQHQHHNAQHMLIPLQTQIKVAAAGSGVAGTSMVSNFIRKRESDNLPFRAAKNLAPTLLAMPSNNLAAAHSSVAPMSNMFNISSNTSTSTMLTSDILHKRERAYTNVQDAAISTHISNRMQTDSPISSDGSTTVSANSSPDIDMQIPDSSNNSNIIIGRIQGAASADMCPALSSNMSEMHFNPINEVKYLMCSSFRSSLLIEKFNI